MTDRMDENDGIIIQDVNRGDIASNEHKRCLDNEKNIVKKITRIGG